MDAALRSALLVLGRRHHRLPLGTHLGPVARAALNVSACPVLMVIPVATVHDPATAHDQRDVADA